VLSCHFKQRRKQKNCGAVCMLCTIDDGSQHVAKLVARPGTRHQRKTAHNYAGFSILLCSQKASRRASICKPCKQANHANSLPAGQGSGAEAEARATHRFWRLGRLRTCLPIGFLAFLPVGTTSFFLFFAGRRRQRASRRRAPGQALRAAAARCQPVLVLAFMLLPTRRCEKP